MKKHILSFVILGSLVLSCENEIPYNQGDKNPKLIMNALINADSLENVLVLQYTGSTRPGYVSDATLEVRVNGELKETPPPMEDEPKSSKWFLIKSRFKPGDVVRIDARTGDGKHHAWIEETVPQPIEIISVDTATMTGYPGHYLYAGQRMRVKTTFRDAPGQKNYYRIVHELRISLKGKTEQEKDTVANYKNYNYWPWEDVVLTDGYPVSPEDLDNEFLTERISNNYGVFDDSRFAGSHYTMTTQSFLSYPFYTNFMTTHISADLIIRVLSITEIEYYYFHVLNFLGSDMYDEFLNDPPKIPGNVHGGTGIVGFSTENSKAFSIFKDKELLYTNPWDSPSP